MTQLLRGKNAIVYGAGGGLGGGIARTFANEGSNVFLAGRTQAPLDAVATDILGAGGSADVAVVDALDEQAIDEHAKSVVARAGSIDVSFNLISRDDVQGIPLVDMTYEDLARPVTIGLKTQFLTARAAARQMRAQGSGVILYLTSGTSAAAQGGGFNMGGTGPADAAVEVFMRYLAGEVGREGVRVVGLWTAGVPETFGRPDDTNETRRSSGLDADAIERAIGGMAILGRAPRLAQVADAAAFLASDRAAAITSTIVNVTCGLVPV